MFMNGGDAAIQLASQKILRTAMPDAEFTYCDSGAPAVNRYYPDFDIRPQHSDVMARDLLLRLIYRFAKGRHYFRARRLYLAGLTRMAKLVHRLGLPQPTASMRALAPYFEADLVISAGGTYLVSKYDITGRILEFQKDAALDLPLILFTQSLEPFVDDHRSAVLGKYLRQAPLILVRHADSRDNVRALTGSDANVEVVADSVFALWEPGPTSMTDRRIRAKRPTDDALRLAISVRSLTAFGDRSTEEGTRIYHDAIRAAVTWAVRQKDAKITFLSTCQGIPEYRLDDSLIALKIADGLPEDVRPHVKVDHDFHAPNDLMKTLEGFDAVLASRLHMAILSMCANTPALPISYEPKFEETFDDLGQPELVTRVGDIESASFVAQLQDFLTRLDEINEQTDARMAAMQRSAMSAGRDVRKIAEPLMSGSEPDMSHKMAPQIRP